MSLLEVKRASFGYSQQDVFTDVNFSVSSGEVLCIVGPNGCGKTTLLDCILGVLKLKQGDILMAGQSVTDLKPHMIARHIAYVPQSHVKTFPYTIMDVVLMGRASHTGLFSSPSEDDREIAQEALKRVGLWGLKDRPYTQLSGGQGQLVMLARALAQRTNIIIMDEPTAHLDFNNELIVLETIVEMVKNTGISVIMATHFPNHAFYFENNNLPTSIAMMDKMTLSTIGSPSVVLSEENIKSLYNIDARIISCSLGNNNVIKQIIPISTSGK